MELRALYEALRAFPPTVPLLVQADSQYVIRIFTEWVDGWMARGWRTADRKPVGNRPNIELIVSLLDGRDIEWEHVRGHAGHDLNELVDKRARAAATAIRDGLPVDSGPGRKGPRDDD
jgi:ribonuclease HI